MTHAALPSLDDDDALALGEDAELEGLGDTPLDAAIDVLLPVDL